MKWSCEGQGKFCKRKHRRTHCWKRGRTLASQDAAEADQYHVPNHRASYHAVPCIHFIVVAGSNASRGIQEAWLGVTFVKPWTQPWFQSFICTSGLRAFPLCSWPPHGYMQATHLMRKSLSKIIDRVSYSWHTRFFLVWHWLDCTSKLSEVMVRISSCRFPVQNQGAPFGIFGGPSSILPLCVSPIPVWHAGCDSVPSVSDIAVY